MNTYDITLTFTKILLLLSNGVKFCFSFLSSIEFFGTNLLSFSISILILGVIFSIIFPVVRSVGTGYAMHGIRSSIKNRKNKGDD